MSIVSYAKYRTSDGAILGRSSVALGTELPQIAGIERLEIAHDQALDGYRVDLDSLELVARSACPVTIGEPIALEGGWEVSIDVPPGASVWIEFDNSVQEVTDGVITLDLDAPGSYNFNVTHPLYLEYVGSVEIPGA